MKKLLLAAVLAALAPAARAQPVTIKLGTLAPQGSTWHDILKEMAQRWEQVSGGQVKLRIYAGGAQGSEGDMVRKLGIGQLQAAAISNVGMHDVIPEPQAFSVPFLFDDQAQMECAFGKMRPRLEADMLSKGFVVLNWADGGWNHIFSKAPVTTPDDMRKLKMFSWAGDPKTTEAWKKMGFDPRPAPSTELATGLQTGLFEVFLAPPQVALITRYYEHTKYMTDLPWQILMGATVIRKDAWERIPADLRPKLLEVAKSAGARLQQSISQSQQRDVDAMKRTGLVVVPVDARAREAWRRTTESAYSVMRAAIPVDAFDDALRYRDEYRRQKGAAKK